MIGDRRLSPCGALFDFLKKYGRIKHSEAAALLLSGKPLSDGKSALARAGEPTWLSRFIVNAPQETLQRTYFSDPGISSIKIASRLVANHGVEHALELADSRCKEALLDALEPYGQARALFSNSYERFRHAPGLSACEHLEAVMVLCVSTAVLGNVREAVLYTLDYCRTIWGGVAMKTLEASPLPNSQKPTGSASPLGLLKVVDGHCNGSAYWIQPGFDGCVIGSMALNEFDISDVGPHVSAQHARIWDENGAWFIEDLDSTNGTVVSRNGENCAIVNSPEDNRFELKPGDQLILANETRFILVSSNPAMA